MLLKIALYVYSLTTEYIHKGFFILKYFHDDRKICLYLLYLYVSGVTNINAVRNSVKLYLNQRDCFRDDLLFFRTIVFEVAGVLEVQGDECGKVATDADFVQNCILDAFASG